MRRAEVRQFLEGQPGKGAETLVAIREGGRPIARTFDSGDIDNALEWLAEQNGKEANCYFHLNLATPEARNRKARREDIQLVRQLGVDIDRPEALQEIEAFPLKPSAVIWSGGGYQVFFFLRAATTDIERAERDAKALAETMGGDHCHSADHLFRIPGTLNWPNAKKRASGRTVAEAYIVRALTDFARAYSLDDVEEALASLRPAQTAPDAGLGPIVLQAADDLPARVANSTRDLIQFGDDADNPIGSAKAAYLSRSHVAFRVVCDLAKAEVAREIIAGILLNPQNGISASILDKPNPEAYARRQASRAYEVVSGAWPDVDRTGVPRATYRNALVGLQRMGLVPEFDQFANRKRVNGYPLQDVVSELSDDLCARLRGEFLARFGFDPRKEHIIDAVHGLCVENPVHPIRTYLDGLRWDGVPRLGGMLSTYFGAEDTQLHRAMAEKVMVAAVRRVREPGAKFDTILVLEGPQGSGKSQALEILAGVQYHSDQEILAMDPKSQAEALEGIWIFELCELQGLNKADIDRVKAFASRRVDRMRPAYARFRENHPRQTVFIGTTNDDRYLRDQTGNRRFWPVKTAKIDLEALRRDRDQLWAEAAHLEAQCVAITLPEELWPAAAEAQASRVLDDPWADMLAEVRGTVESGVERVTTAKALQQLEVNAAHMSPASAKRIGPIMRDLGWDGPKRMRIQGKVVRGYERPTGAPDSPKLDDPVDMPGYLRKPDPP
jgi:energy-coupling factor transporter ATP-binding protein EcfA2